MSINLNSALDNFSLEMKVLLATLSLENSRETLDSLEAQKYNVDWARFLELALHHRVYPLVYRLIKEYGIHWFPQNVILTLKGHYQINTIKMLALKSEMIKVVSAFNEKTIPVIMLKGPLLAEFLYGDVSLRTSKDLDVLVPIDALDKAEFILQEKGYVLTESKVRILNDWKVRDHHISYRHPEKGIQIELHWRMNPGNVDEPSFDVLWKRKQEARLSSQSVFLLGTEDLFSYLVLHGARHGWFRLRWLKDIDSLLNKEKNVIELLDKEANLQQAIIGQVLLLCDTLFNRKVDSKFNKIVKIKKAEKLSLLVLSFIKDPINMSPVPPTKELKNKFSKYLRTLNTVKQNAKSVIQLMRPSSKDAKFLPLPKPLHFMYFVLRPFLWIFRKKYNVKF